MTASPPARLRLGMVGGGRGAFIGETHRIAARLDDRYELVAGALSADPQRAIESGRDLRLDPMRCYTDYRGMAQAEASARTASMSSASSRRTSRTTRSARGFSRPGSTSSATSR